ncbi:MAG: NAD(P)-dependent oxidoreductase [Tepidisphaeraceae bacterium]
MAKLAFIGLGIMGAPMAAHLLAGGHGLVVHSRTKSRADELITRGARWSDSPQNAAENAQVVFVCVPDTPDVEDVIAGARGIIHAARDGLIVVDHSTISPSVTQRLAAKLARRGTALIDAPVSGGDVGAKNATLSIMCGGEQAAFRNIEPLLKLMGKNIVHCGPSGAGQLTKLVNQILVSVTNMAVSEALSFAKKCGLDLAKTIAGVGGGAAGSWQLANLGPKMVAGDFRPGFMIDLQQKDLRLALESAAAAMAYVPATTLVHRLFQKAQNAGRGRDGTQSLFTVFDA